MRTPGPLEGRPQLGRQKSTPDTWIHILLKAVATVELSATLAFRAGNLYLVGFRTHDDT
jgi:hypothetical protein